jgi:hypothetical protein
MRSLEEQRAPDHQSEPFGLSKGENIMVANKVESFMSLDTPDSLGTAKAEPKQENYHVPELRLVGTLEIMRGRNFYRDKDAGNDNYYI